jgi:hypothetical protein
MASGVERPDIEALRELEEVVRHFESELASWRRRALSAESRLAEVSGDEPGAQGVRSQELEEENRVLVQRLQAAKGRLGELLDRLRFLDQQQGNGGPGR